MDNFPVLETISTACRRYSIAPQDMDRLMELGKVKCVAYGGKTLVVTASLDAFFSSLIAFDKQSPMPIGWTSNLSD